VIEQPWKLAELEPSAALDRRVRRRIRAARPTRRRAAPFFPFERAVYAVVLVVYALHAGARVVELLQAARRQEILAMAPKQARLSSYEGEEMAAAGSQESVE
jgi:hypothetical protein